MRPSFKKRFWKAARTEAVEGGFAVLLDQHRVMTPAKNPFVVPTAALADAIAAEWDAQIETVNPAKMPNTRRANAAIDKVTPQQAEVVDLLVEYGGSDLLCYRAAHPAELHIQQAATWDPLLDWARKDLGVDLQAVSGVMHHQQPDASIAKIRSLVGALDPFPLTGFYDLVTLPGSMIVAFATILKQLEVDDAWELSRIDEAYQAELWGADEEATEVAEAKHQDFLAAFKFFTLSNAT